MKNLKINLLNLLAGMLFMFLLTFFYNPSVAQARESEPVDHWTLTAIKDIPKELSKINSTLSDMNRNLGDIETKLGNINSSLRDIKSNMRR